MKITIFTPTYNRAHLLPRLYKSIVCQTSNIIEWLIVDDGSSDETSNVVEKFIQEKKINIRYFSKTNGGKHTAINLGVQKAAGELFVIIDSDDILDPNSLQIISEKYADVRSNKTICGVIGLSAYPDGTIVGTHFLKNNWEVSFADVYLKYKVKGDKAVALRTDVMRKFPFPEPQGIRFVFEAVVWHEMAKEYKVIAINEILQYVEYQESGVSGSSYKNWYVKSLAFSYFTLIKNRTHSPFAYPETFIWNFIHLALNSLLSNTSYFKRLNFYEKLMYITAYPRAYYSYRKMKKLIHD